MTPEQLEVFIVTADGEGLANAIASLTEPERAKLSNHAVKIWKNLHKADDLEHHFSFKDSEFIALCTRILGRKQRPHLRDQEN